MGSYDMHRKECPYCKEQTEADWVDVGIGMIQCGPFHCTSCGASEIGPEIRDWYYKDREGKVIYLPGKRIYLNWNKKKCRSFGQPILIPNSPFSSEELATGYYINQVSPYANTVNGQLVDCITAKDMYNVGKLDKN